MNKDSLINDAFSKLADISEAIIFYSIDLNLVNAAGDSIKLPLILLWLVVASVFFYILFRVH